MRTFGERYRGLRFYTHASWRASGSVFSNRDDPLISARTLTVGPGGDLAHGKEIARLLIKPYLLSEISAEVPPTWSELKAVLASKTKSAPAKKDLAKRLGVTLAAISQWRSGANAPSAENALRILRWIREIGAKKEAKGGNSVSEIRPRRKRTKLRN
jgi:DNA-binding transcriptional regulator YdaS (Cro superfamily)